MNLPRFLSREFWARFDREARRTKRSLHIALPIPGIRGVAVMTVPPANGKGYLAAMSRASGRKRRDLTLAFLRANCRHRGVKWLAAYPDRFAAASTEVQDYAADAIEAKVRATLRET